MPCGTPLNTLQAVVPRSPLGPAENIALFEYSGPDDCLFGFLNGKFERGSIEQFYRNVDTVGAGENFKTRIDVLELEETLAVVRVLEEGWGGKIDFTDVLLLLKIDGEWKCVAKAYNQNSNTVEK